MKTPFTAKYVIAIAWLCPTVWALGQAASTMHKSAAVESFVPELTLSYSKPETSSFESKQSGMLGNQLCGPDGSIFFQANADSLDAPDAFQLRALRPSGEITLFLPGPVHGYRSIEKPSDFFVGDSSVVALARAVRDEGKPGEQGNWDTLVLVYDLKGSLQHAFPLELGLHPTSIGAFASGDVLVSSLDKLNQQTRLFILDSSGGQQRELRLFDQDYSNAKGDGLFEC